MKKLYILGAVAMVAASMTSCDDFLEDRRYPLSEQTSSPAFWNSPINVQGQIDYFYQSFLGYNNGSGTGEFYFRTLSDDQICPSGEATETQWKNTTVPAASSNWSSPYTEIRRANLIIDNVGVSTMTDADKNNFLGIARLYRAYQYFLLVRAYGDVPLFKTTVQDNDPDQLYRARDPRNEVMDFILEEVDFAIANIAKASSKNTFSVDLAKAMKVEFCLFEGSYAKYHQNDNARAQKYFGEVVNTAPALIAAYPLCDNYQSLYNSFRAAASSNSEIIFMKEYEKDLFMHCTVDYTSSSTPVSGMTKDAFDAYLFKDGKPRALTTCDVNDAGVLMPDGVYSISAALAVRDDRLAQTVDTAVYFDGLPYQRPNSMVMTSLTGYGVKKFNNEEMHYDYTATTKNYTCAPLYWGAQIYLAFAEAKAELGQFDAAALDALNAIYTRAGLPAQTKASLESMNDPDNNMGVTSLLWEVRRARRCEFIFDRDMRYWDLVRWHQLNLLETTNAANYDIVLGANISACGKEYRQDSRGYLIAPNTVGTRKMTGNREYLFPVPSGQITLYNEAIGPDGKKGYYELTQNPGWE